MIRLPESLQAWGTPSFEAVLKAEVERLDPWSLPLQDALRRSSHVTDRPFQVRVITRGAADGRCRARIGVFYSGIIAGCSCADDPTPIDEISEYCEMQLDIDPASAEATVTLLDD